MYTEKEIQENLNKVIMEAPANFVIWDSFGKANATIPQFKKVSVGISGGSDSDVVMDLIKKLYFNVEIDFVWFDTGIEYKATKEHLEYLEKKYDTKIQRIRAFKPIPMSVREYGQPFLSKYASEMISRLQKHNFDFSKANDYNFEEAYKLYPKCKVALRWFYNDNENVLDQDGNIKTISSFNIDRNKYLRDYLIEHPPTFKISNACCQWAKKKPAMKYVKDNNIDLNIIGVRKSEGGIRSSTIKGCFSRDKDVANYRPIFHYKDHDKLEYNDHYQVINSLCYSGYGLSRTGCAGCPFGRDFEQELKIIEEHEPKLYKAVNNIFGDSYEYTRKYWDYRQKKDNKNQQIKLF